MARIAAAVAAFSMSVVLKVSLKFPEVISVVKSGYIDGAASVASASPPVAAMLVVAWGAPPQRERQGCYGRHHGYGHEQAGRALAFLCFHPLLLPFR
ncbi:MAG: hypothetical protein ACLUW6_10350 [Coriobacteriaceae bacterium]